MSDDNWHEYDGKPLTREEYERLRAAAERVGRVVPGYTAVMAARRWADKVRDVIRERYGDEE